MTYQISKKNAVLKGEVKLPQSKSINNRHLLITALRQKLIDPNGTENDWKLQELKPSFKLKNIKKFPPEALAAIRYLKHYFRKKQGEWVIYGSKKLKRGPIKDILKGLTKIGGYIRFEQTEEFQRLQVSGTGLKGHVRQVNAVVTREFVEVSLFFDPDLSLDKVEETRDKIIHSSFVNIAIKLLKNLGLRTIWSESEILVENEFFDGSKMHLESDWSLASYFYEKVVLSSKAELTIHGLSHNSFQRHQRVSKLFRAFGVETTYLSGAIHLTKHRSKVKSFVHDFSDYPNLIPAFAVTCAIKRIPFKLKGVELLDTEGDENISSLQQGLAALGYHTHVNGEGLEWDGKERGKRAKEINLSNIKNSRIAMAFYPVALTGKTLVFDGSKGVNTALPSYWKSIMDFKFEIS